MDAESRRTDGAKGGRLSVTEIYASIQGESTHTGRPCTFIRLAGCPLRCRWCDTTYSFTEGTVMPLAEILDTVASMGINLVEVTGGEPLAQPGCAALLHALCEAGHEVLLETSGAYPWDGLDRRVRIIADLKCPGSGESHRNLLADLGRLRATDELKIVAADSDDLDWALARLDDELKDLPSTVLWSPVHGELAPSDLADWMLSNKAPGRLQIQLHKVLWPQQDRGV